jgi:hypothetical protein
MVTRCNVPTARDELRALRVLRTTAVVGRVKPWVIFFLLKERIVGTFLKLLMGGASLVAPMADHRPRSSYESDNVPWSKAVTRRAMTTAIGGELRARYQPPDQLSPELRQLLRKVQCSVTRHSCNRPRRSHEMWLTDDEPRRIAEISLHFLSS